MPIEQKRGNARPRGGGRRSLSKAAAKLTQDDREKAEAITEAWHGVRRRRDYHRERLRAGLALLESRTEPGVAAHIENDIESARQWIELLDAAILLFADKGGAAVLQAAEDEVEKSRVNRSFPIVERAMRMIKEHDTRFADLEEKLRVDLALMVRPLPLPNDEGPASADAAFEIAAATARTIIDGDEVMGTLNAEGPIRAAHIALARLCGISPRTVARYRGKARRPAVRKT